MRSVPVVKQNVGTIDHTSTTPEARDRGNCPSYPSCNNLVSLGAIEAMRILVLGYMVRSGMGGIAWHYLHYVVGLARLGHDVYFMEDSGDVEWSCHHPKTGALDTDPSEGLEFTSSVFDRLGFGDRWAYYDAHRARWLGPAGHDAVGIFRSADAFINVSGSNAIRPWSEGVPIRVMIDTDPALHQIRNNLEPERRERSLAHTHFFSFGENIGSPISRIPTDGFVYHPTRQPFVLDLWPESPGSRSGAFTSIMHWESYAPREYGDIRYGMKGPSFEPYVDVPRHTTARLELALGGPAPRADLRASGWEIRNPLDVSVDPWDYRRYIEGSKGEFGIAKQAYVVSRSGWFSERTVGYLASGRPVVVQDTGFGAWLSPTPAVRPFGTLEQATAALDEVEADYESACRAARGVAEEYFDYRDVLGRLLRTAA